MKKEQKKFAKIYDKLVAKVFRFIFLKVDSPETAEDLTSQVFAKAFDRTVKRQAKVKNLPAYIYQLARAEVADYYRKNAKYKIISTESAQIFEQIPDGQVSPEDSYQIQADLKALKTSLGELDEDAQNVLIWRYLDGLSYAQMAEIMEKPESTVRVMVHRALKELKEKLDQN